MRMQPAEAAEGEAMTMESRSNPRRGLVAVVSSVSPASYLLAVLAMLAATLFIFMDHDSIPARARGLLATSFTPSAHPVEAAFVSAVPENSLPKAAGAYGIALLLAALSFRRRAVVPARPKPLHELLAIIPFA